MVSCLIKNTCIGKGEGDPYLQIEGCAAPFSTAHIRRYGLCCALRPETGQSSGGSLAALQLSEALVPTLELLASSNTIVVRSRCFSVATGTCLMSHLHFLHKRGVKRQG